MITNKDWDDFVASQKEYHGDVMNKTLYWLKNKPLRRRNNHGSDGNDEFSTPIEIPCLLNYNVRRTWPINTQTEVGEVDGQSVQAFLSKPWLIEKGYNNLYNRLDYNPSMDRFILDGIVYRADGDTPASEVDLENDLLFTIILKVDIKSKDLLSSIHNMSSGEGINTTPIDQCEEGYDIGDDEY